MKKLYFLLVALLISNMGFGQIISQYVETNSGSNPKGIEIWNNTATTLDFTTNNLVIEKGTNGASPSTDYTLDSGTLASGNVIVIGTSDMQTITEANGSVWYLKAFTFNGDDALVVKYGGTVTDVFGDPGTGDPGAGWSGNGVQTYNQNIELNSGITTGDTDGWTDPSSRFSTVSSDPVGAGGLDGFGIAPSSSPSCGVSLGTATFLCSSNNIGDNNDDVTIQIPYTGVDTGITSVTTTSGGSVFGGDPASDTDGTIVITGLSEGDAWDITLNGGDCDGITTSGTVPSDECDPAPNTCYDLSGGGELFELVTVASNSAGDAWTFSSGTYSMNGFCGTSCTEASDTWLIFGPLDMTGVSDLALLFDAAESFDGTDLNIQFTSDYSSLCPSGATWTSAQTIVGDGTGTGNYTVDLSAATGTDVFVGIQYLDSDGFPNSGWSLSNVELASFGITCPTLGTRPTSDCATCDLVLESETYNCQSATTGDGNDEVYVDIPYSGSEDTITSLSTTSGGTITGDDPTTVADGTITITGLFEGQAWNLTINGGDCDGTTVSGTIPSSICDPIVCASPGDILISEVMRNPAAVGDDVGEYFEVYNNTGSSIDMRGWIIKDDATASEAHAITSSVVVSGGGYAVFVINGDSGVNGGISGAYSYEGDISLGNSGTDGIIIECSGTVIDQVIWDGTFPPASSGVSMEFSNTFLARLNNTDNDNGANWGLATTAYGSGDLGSPGVANDFALSSKSFDEASFNIYPNPTNIGFVNISSKSSEVINAKVFDILGKEVMKGKVENNQLDVSSLNAGMYILRLSQNNATVTKKLVIQ
jgi:hypothetical protein